MRALVTGGGGFLGLHIVQLLRARGDDVVVVGRNRYPEVEALGAQSLVADIIDESALAKALHGVDLVFHVAAKAGAWGRRDDFFRTNVDGTRSVLRAMQRAGVRKLVYTSTPSVVGYDHDVENGGAELPYARRHESAYAASKARAEQMVRAANGSRLATVCLRPHLIIGQGDRNLLPAIISRAASGRLPIVGDGLNRVDITYVDNAAWAHLDAADALHGSMSPCAGKAYFISNDEPVALWPWLNGVLRSIGLPEVTRRVPLSAARLLGLATELAWRSFGIAGEPRLTRFVATAMARSHWYDMKPARDALGYTPRVPMNVATERTIAWLGSHDVVSTRAQRRTA